MLSNILAQEIPATWAGDSVKVAAVASEDTTPPPVVNSAPEAAASGDATPPPVVDLAPEDAAPNTEAPLTAKPINWPVLWGVVGGVVLVGLIIFLLARRKAY